MGSCNAKVKLGNLADHEAKCNKQDIEYKCAAGNKIVVKSEQDVGYS